MEVLLLDNAIFESDLGVKQLTDAINDSTFHLIFSATKIMNKTKVSNCPDFVYFHFFVGVYRDICNLSDIAAMAEVERQAFCTAGLTGTLLITGNSGYFADDISCSSGMHGLWIFRIRQTWVAKSIQQEVHMAFA